MSKPKNPPAFPRPASDSEKPFTVIAQSGMTLLDHFAGRVISGMMANSVGIENMREGTDAAFPDATLSESLDYFRMAATKTAYNMAEAMLKEREERLSP